VQPLSEKWVQFQWPKDWANMEFMTDLRNALIEGIPLAQNANNPNIDSSTMTLIFLTDNNFSKCDFSFDVIT
jgi:hypothetical protein